MEALVKHVARTTFEDLPNEVISVTKRAILDTFGVMIGGSSVEGCKLLVDYINDWKGREESTIAVFGGKAPAPLAAQANGAMARAFEMDDVIDVFPLHPSASIIPACLAVSERQGRVSGKAFITAVALAHDLVIRLALSIKTSPIISGRYNLFEVFAIAASAGKLLELTESQLLDAVGITYSQMVGDGKAPRDGVMTSYIQQGTKAKSAIEAALMASVGISGTHDVLKGPHGFYQAYEPNPNLEPLYHQLGVVYKGLDLSVKLHTACRCAHQAIDLAEQARNQGLDAGKIDHIRILVNDQTWNLVCDPVEEKRKPQTHVDAQFSLPYTVAAMIVRGSVFIDEVSDHSIRDEQILHLAQRINPVFDLTCQSELAVGSVRMEIKTTNGERVTLKSDFPKGNPQNPVTMEDCIRKFEKCTKFAARQFTSEQINLIIKKVDDLEEVDDMRELADLLVPG